ncbi:MAG: ferrous iron transport protein A [Isosphaeraceae bacterium]
MSIRLSELAKGRRARVVGVDAATETGVRILEMGLTPGATVVLTGAAPLGDPLAFEVRGYRLSLRKVEADLVQVEECQAEP